MIADEIYQDFDAAGLQWGSLVGLLTAGKHNMLVPRSTLRGMSTMDLDKRIQLAYELLRSIRPEDDDNIASVLLGARLTELKAALQQIHSHSSSAASTLVNAGCSPEIQLADGDDAYSLRLLHLGTQVAQVDLTSSFAQIGDASASLLTVASQIVPLCRVNGSADLGVRSIYLAKREQALSEMMAQAEQMLLKFDHVQQRASSLTEEATSMNVQISSNLDRIRELLSQANADSGQVTALVEQVRTTAASAETLGQSVLQFQGKFDAFHTSMDQRNDELRLLSNELLLANKENDLRESRITDLIKQSNDMLAGSTSAGLGVSLEQARSRYESRMIAARQGFYFAVVVLLVSAIPLAAHLVPNLFGNLIPSLDPKQDGSPLSVVGKVLLLLPATWLTAFFTKTYADLFQLEREYAHKAALAGSVHGFKLQAPKYEEEITAEVFMEIRMNPARGPAVEAASHPLYDVLAKVVGKVLDKAKSESKEAKG